MEIKGKVRDVLFGRPKLIPEGGEMVFGCITLGV